MPRHYPSRKYKLHTFRGQSLNLKDWAKAVGLNYQTLKSRIHRLKWPLEVALAEASLGPGRRGNADKRPRRRNKTLPSSRLQVYFIPLEFREWSRSPNPLANSTMSADTPSL